MIETTENREITPQALVDLGLQQIAYVKKVDIDNGQIYTVFAADGQQLGGFENRDVALAACIQNDLEPVSVH